MDVVLFDRLKKEVSSQGYASVSFAISFSEIESAAEIFTRSFLALPQIEKERYVTFIDPAKKKGKCGYRRRDKGKGDADAKEIFHYNDFVAEFVSRMSGVPSEVRAFMDAAKPVYEEVKSTMRSILESFEPEVPGITESFFPEGKHPYFYLRFLAYVASGPGDTIAEPHIDKGPFTLAIHESHPGLRIGRYVDEQLPDNLEPVIHKPGEAFFFTGDYITELLPPELQAYFPKGLHDVIQISEREDQKIARTAIVAFIDQSDLFYKKAWAARHPLTPA